jgi:nucleotide-binding universal stress UspA family protein
MSEQPHPVLVGIDGTASGLEALALGGALAVLTGAPLVLGAVFSFEGESWPPVSHAERWLDEATQHLGDAIPWSTRMIASTSPAHGLTMLAKLVDPAWIVVGSSRRGPVGRVLVGTTANGVVHGAPCAVAVVPKGWRVRGPEQSLVFGVGVNRSPEAAEALRVAAELSQGAHAPLRVITAVPVPSPAHPMFAATGTSYEQWRSDEHRNAERLAREAAASVDVETEVMVVDGDPVERLAEASSDLVLLIVGSRRYGPLRRSLVGSVSSRLLDRAHAAVLIVPRGVHTELMEPDAVSDAAPA